MTDYKELERRLGELSPDLYPIFSQEFGDTVIAVEHPRLLETAERLKELGFDRLGMVTAIDRDDSFVMVYRITSRALSASVFLKARISKDDAHVPSLFGVWPAANWQEREVYDMFGIVFDDHPDLRRMLLPEDWVGHPLRKDYQDDRIIKRPDYI